MSTNLGRAFTVRKTLAGKGMSIKGVRTILQKYGPSPLVCIASNLLRVRADTQKILSFLQRSLYVQSSAIEKLFIVYEISQCINLLLFDCGRLWWTAPETRKCCSNLYLYSTDEFMNVWQSLTDSCSSAIELKNARLRRIPKPHSQK